MDQSSFPPQSVHHFSVLLSNVTCTWRITVQVNQWLHVALSQPLLVGLSIANTDQANSGVFKDEICAFVALWVKHPETRTCVTAKIGLKKGTGDKDKKAESKWQNLITPLKL